MPSMKEITKTRLLEEMIRAVHPENEDGQKVLVVDVMSMKIISAVLRMFDIMEEGVTLVENITLDRQPIPGMDVIYFITPTEDSIDRVIADYANYPKKKMYGTAHLFFTSALPQMLMTKIGGSKLVSKVKTLKEMHCEFIAYEQQVFHLGTEKGTKLFFTPQARNIRSELQKVATKLATSCINLGENPYIRHCAAGSPHSRTLATLLQPMLSGFYEDQGISMIDRDRPRGTLLVLDRTVDCAAPLLHECTYQAMITDLLEIENDRYRYTFEKQNGQKETTEVLLNETDTLWPTLRHMFISESIEYCTDHMNEFLKQNAEVNVKKGGVRTMKDISAVIKELPQYSEQLKKYSLHLELNRNATEAFSSQGLNNIVEIEQSMATGEDDGGAKFTQAKALSALIEVLASPEVSAENKVRLLMLFIVTQEGIKTTDRNKLIERARLSIDDQRLLQNLSYLNVTLEAGSTKAKSKQRKQKGGETYSLARYTPQIKTIAEELLDDKLSTTDFPFIGDTPSASSGRKTAAAGTSARSAKAAPRWAKGKTGKKAAAEEVPTGERLIIFVLGGMTYSEMRSVYELTKSNHREVIIGSTHILTPSAFIGEVKELKAAAAAEDDE